MGASGSSAPVLDATGVGVVPSTIIDAVSTNGMIDDESGTRFEGPRPDVDAPVP